MSYRCEELGVGGGGGRGTLMGEHTVIDGGYLCGLLYTLQLVCYSLLCYRLLAFRDGEGVERG